VYQQVDDRSNPGLAIGTCAQLLGTWKPAIRHKAGIGRASTGKTSPRASVEGCGKNRGQGKSVSGKESN